MSIHTVGSSHVERKMAQGKGRKRERESVEVEGREAIKL